MKENVHIKKHRDALIVSSSQEVRGVKGYLIIHGYDAEEESNPKNIEVLKVFASQALFVYSYIQHQQAQKKG